MPLLPSRLSRIASLHSCRHPSLAVKKQFNIRLFCWPSIRPSVMTNSVAAWSIAVATMLVDCATIPDYALKQEEQRRQFLLACSNSIQNIDRGPNPAEVSLDACRQYISLARSMMNDFESRSEHDELSRQEWQLVRRIRDDNEFVVIKGCYAKVKRGDQVSDGQGHVGIAVCDRILDELRHQHTLEAIDKAKDEAIGSALIFQKNR